MADLAQVREHMEIIGADGVHVGTVDKVDLDPRGTLVITYRIQKDKADGMAPDVQGTPAFFLDGEKIQPSSEEEFRRLIETAIIQEEPLAQ